MNFFGYFFLAFVGLVIGAVLYAWWHKFVSNRPDKYGKGPGYDLRGAERGNWVRARDERPKQD